MIYVFESKDAMGTDGTDPALVHDLYSVTNDDGFQWSCRVPPGTEDITAYIQTAWERKPKPTIV